MIEPSEPGLESSTGSILSGGSLKPGKRIRQPSPFEDEEIIEEAKYHSPAPVPPADEGELPDSYPQPRVTVMVVDPYLVYAYWNVDPTRLPPQAMGAALRFHDVSEPSSSHGFDVDVDFRTRNWYVHLWSPAKSYYAELGVKTADGGFTSLARSNKFQTPRAWPMAEIERPAMPADIASPHFTPPVSPGTPEQARVEVTLQHDEIAVSTGRPASEGLPDVSPSAAPPQPETRKPGDAAEVLQRKLSEIYSLRQLHPRALTAMGPAQYDAPPPGWVLEEPLPEIVKLPTRQDATPLLSQPRAPFDLTAFDEHQFKPGFSSALVFPPTPERPPG